jgi:hypothetical protein
MNVYLGAGLVCLFLWAGFVYAAGIGSAGVHVLVAVGFVLVARGLLKTRAS